VIARFSLPRRDPLPAVAPVLIGLLLCLLVTGVMLLRPGAAGLTPALMLVAGAVVAPLVWRKPQAAVYLLFALAVVVEEQPLLIGSSFTDKIPAFKDIQSLIGVRPLPMTSVELLAAAALAVVLVRAHASGSRLEGGPLITPFALLLGVLALAVAHGVFSGGNATLALWGVRGFGNMFLAYLLAVNLLKSPSQVRPLFLILVLGAVLKGLDGMRRYALDFHFDLSRVTDVPPGNSLMAHEESFFYLLLPVLLVLGSLYWLRPADRRLSLLGALVVALPLLANQRRAGIAALVLVLAILAVAGYALEPQRRPAILRTLAVALVLLPPYFALGWGHDTVLTMPVQAIKSEVSPDARDASSDEYRRIENLDLRATAKRNPLFGVGYGLPMEQPVPLPNIGSSYTWYLYQPHNQVLWLAMTGGVIALAAFGYLVISAALLSVRALCLPGPLELRAAYALGLAALAAFVVFALLDQGLTSQRLCVFMGIQLGLLALSEPGDRPGKPGKSAEVGRMGGARARARGV
jgi:hypothetical protein